MIEITEEKIDKGREDVAWTAGAVMADVGDDKKVVVGTRRWLGPEWVHVDIDPTDLIDPETGDRHAVNIVGPANRIRVSSNSAGLLYSQEMLEHVPRKEYFQVLKEWARIVKQGGYLWIEVPDFLACCEQVLKTDTLEMDRGIQQLFYGGQDNEWDFHFNGFTPRIFEDDFDKLGFDVVSMRNGYEAGYLQAIGKKR